MYSTIDRHQLSEMLVSQSLFGDNTNRASMSLYVKCEARWGLKYEANLEYI